MPEFQPNAGGFNPPSAFPGQGVATTAGPPQVFQPPQRGAFAMSETVPLIQQYAARMEDARQQWHAARIEANEKKGEAVKTRAQLMIKLRIWGNPETGSVPIKTNVELKMWADADSDVLRAELDADLAQTNQMHAKEAYEEVCKVFDTLQSLMGMERDDMKRGYGNAGQFGP